MVLFRGEERGNTLSTTIVVHESKITVRHCKEMFYVSNMSSSICFVTTISVSGAQYHMVKLEAICISRAVR